MDKYNVRILIVTQKYFPHGDATSAVLGNLCETLIASGCKVDLVAVTSRKEDSDITEWNNVHVKQLFVEELISLSQLKNNIKSDAALAYKTIFKKVLNKTKMQFGANRKLFLDPAQVKAYDKALKKRLEDQQYDLCLVTLAPINAIRAAFSKEYKVPIAVYQLDTYWNNDALPEKYRKSRLQYEAFIVDRSAFVLTTPIIAKTNYDAMPELKNKLIPVEFPMIREIKEENREKDKVCHCVFTGAFYPGIRPPEKVVSIIAELKDPNTVFDFYGEKQELVMNSPNYKKAESKIVLKGSVSSEEALKARKTADILINVDNTTMTQVPSKIFEYISLGKPIINFYFNSDSPTLEYLHRYPLCLNVLLEENQKKEIIISIERFISNNKDQKIEYETIRKLYEKNTPEYVAKQLLDAYQYYREENKQKVN